MDETSFPNGSADGRTTPETAAKQVCEHGDREALKSCVANGDAVEQTCVADAYADGQPCVTDTDTDGQPPIPPQRPLRKRFWHRLFVAVAWVVACPLIVFVLCAILVYLPPIQRWAVDRAGEWLSEEMAMTVRVRDVRLTPFLHLSLGGMLACQEGDTVVAADCLDVRVRFWPLFRGNVEVDAVQIDDASIDTRQLIEAARVKGRLGRLFVDAHSVHLARNVAVVSHFILDDSNLHVTLTDSVPEDTTQSEPTDWQLRLDDVQLHRVHIALALAPQADSVRVTANIDRAHTVAKLDLGRGRYVVRDFMAELASASYDIGCGAATAGLDPSHLALSALALRIPSLDYDTTEGLSLRLDSLSATERSGLQITRARSTIAMDSLSLRVRNLDFETTASTFHAHGRMDFSAFDSISPGQFKVYANGHFGKSDIVALTAAQVPELRQLWPNAETIVLAAAEGNLRRLTLQRLHLLIPGRASIDATAECANLTDSLLMSADAKLAARIADASFLKPLLGESITLPHRSEISGAAQFKSRCAKVLLSVRCNEGSAEVSGNYGLDDDAYSADVAVHRLRLDNLLGLPAPAIVSATVSAEGRGFDFQSPHTAAQVSVTADSLTLGDIDLSHTTATASLARGIISAHTAIANDRLDFIADADGHIDRHAAEARLALDVRHADLTAMGLADQRLEITALSGEISGSSDFSLQHAIDATVGRLDMTIGEEQMHSEPFTLRAATRRDTTYVRAESGDLHFDFHAPEALEQLLRATDRVSRTAISQIDTHTLRIDQLRPLMPRASLTADAGEANPLAQALALMGWRFGRLRAGLVSTPEQGLTGGAAVLALQNDSVLVDTIFFTLRQDSTRLVLHSGMVCPDQKLFPAFTVRADGYAAPREADLRFTFLNREHRTGLDLGLHANVADSALTAHFYPDEPIIGFTRYHLDTANFVRLSRRGRIEADVQLESLEDSCRIAVFANAGDSLRQKFRAVVQKLDLAQFLKIIPGVPRMSGRFDMDATYAERGSAFEVHGETGVNDFVYEDMPLGNLAAAFHYEPSGTDEHHVRGTLRHNGADIADLEGAYATAGEGRLDAALAFKALPLALASPFIPDHMATLDGNLNGTLRVTGPTTALRFDGVLLPSSARLRSDLYSLDLKFADLPIAIADSRLTLDRYSIMGTGPDPLTLDGWVDFSNFDRIALSLSLYGQHFELINAPRTRRSVLFGKMYGDFFARVTGDTHDMRVRGLVNVLGSSDLTYVMTETPLSVDYRLDDIVTFVDFSAPPEIDPNREKHTFLGIDMQLQLKVEDGAKVNCEFSADRQSYVSVAGGASMLMTYSPEGVLQLTGRYTVNEGEMKYTLPVIPLKTFQIAKGSYVEFTGEVTNPTINFAAAERTKSTVCDENGGRRSVAFDTGLEVTGTLDDMALRFTIEAPEDMAVKNELAAMSEEEKNKLAVGLLCTGMYMAPSNSAGVSANNALNNFLQNEINNIAGQALSTAVDVNVGMEQSTRDDGTTRTDYAFKFSKRFFSDRLNVVIGGRVNADGSTQENEAGAYIDNVSLEYRLDRGGTRFVRLYHEQNYDNLLEGQLIENGASITLRRKLDRLTDFFIWRRRDKKNVTGAQRTK